MSATISKTKKKLIEVARQLFARDGVEQTTMNDIAEASQFGRRTLYTYFKSKTELYNTVIQSELESLYTVLEDVLRRDITADNKLLIFAFSRLNAIKEVVRRNGTLKSDFFRDIWRVESVRKEFDRKEIKYLASIMSEGCENGIFVIKNIPKTAEIIHYALKGLEAPVIRGVLDLRFDRQTDRELISNMIFRGLKAKE